jgi:hypothetical protein
MDKVQLVRRRGSRGESLGVRAGIAVESKSGAPEGSRYERKFGVGLITDEEVGGHGDAYGYYDPADVFLVHFLGVVGAGVAAG